MSAPFGEPVIGPGATSEPGGPPPHPGATPGQPPLGPLGRSSAAARARTVDWKASPGFLVVAGGALLALLGLLPLLSFVLWLLTLLVVAAFGTAAWALRQETIPVSRLRLVAIALGGAGVLSVILLLAGVSTGLGMVGYVLVLLGLLAVAAGAVYEAVSLADSATVAASPRSTPAATTPEPRVHSTPPPPAAIGASSPEASSAGPVAGSGAASGPGPTAAFSSIPPSSTRPTARVHHPWCLVAIGGGVLALIAFFALPAVTLPLFGDITGAQVTSLASQSGDYGSGLGWTAVFWLLPVLAIVAVALAAWTGYSPTAAAGEGRGAFILGVCGVIAGVMQLIGVIALSNQGLGFAISGGAWLTLIAFLAVAAGGFIEYKSRVAAAAAVRSSAAPDRDSPGAPPNSLRWE